VSREPLFSIGAVYGTPGALAHLANSAIPPAALLGLHERGEWGELDKCDVEANNHALKSGARILSAFTVVGERIYVITEAADDAGVRPSTTILLASEY
jgi:hypothetical protein